MVRNSFNYQLNQDDPASSRDQTAQAPSPDCDQQVNSTVRVPFTRLNLVASRKSIVTLAALLSASMVTVAVAEGITKYNDYQNQKQVEFDRQQRSLVTSAIDSQKSNDYSDCILQVNQVDPESTVFAQAQALLSDCKQAQANERLASAKLLAAKGEYKQAIALLNQISDGSSAEEIERLGQQWAEKIVDFAKAYYWVPQDQLDQAIAVANAVPQNNPVYDEAQALISEWRSQHVADQNYLSDLNVALEQGNLSTAREAASQVSQHPFSQSQLKPLADRLEYLEKEQIYWQYWQDAKRYLEQGEPQNAVALINHLPDVAPWAERKQQVTRAANTRQRQIQFCQIISLGLWNCGS